MKLSTGKVMVGVLVTLPLFGFGCGNPVSSLQDRVTGAIGQKAVEGYIENAVEKNSGGKAKVDLSGSQGGMVVRNQDGSYTGLGENLQVPPELPSDFLRYTSGDAKIVQLTIDKDKNIAMTVKTSDMPDAALAWYDGQLTAQGYTKQTTADLMQGKVAIYKKEETTFSVTAGRDEDATDTVLVITRAKSAQ
jgi:hypothetical protein